MSGPAEVITAVPTPFTDSGDLDLVAARELFGFVARTTGRMFVAGTTGEFPALTDAERLSLIKTALDVAGTRRVLVHVGAADAHRARLLTEAAVALGATRLAAITPYFLAAGPAEVADYFEQVAKAAPGCEVYAYLFPERTGVTVRPRQLARIASSSASSSPRATPRAARSRRSTTATPAGPPPPPGSEPFPD